MATVKKWVWPLGRTFLAVFAVTFVAGLAKIDFAHVHVTDLSVVGSLAAGALGAAANVVVLAVQRLLPGVPNPQPPVQPITMPPSA